MRFGYPSRIRCLMAGPAFSSPWKAPTASSSCCQCRTKTHMATNRACISRTALIRQLNLVIMHPSVIASDDAVARKQRELRTRRRLVVVFAQPLQSPPQEYPRSHSNSPAWYYDLWAQKIIGSQAFQQMARAPGIRICNLGIGEVNLTE